MENKVDKSIVKNIVIETIRGVIRGLEFQKKKLSFEPNQEKTVQMSINRLKKQIAFYEDDSNPLPRELSVYFTDQQEPVSEDADFEITYR